MKVDARVAGKSPRHHAVATSSCADTSGWMFWPRMLADVSGTFAVFAWGHEGLAPLLMWQPCIDIMTASDFMEFQIQLSAMTLSTMARQDAVVSLQLLS
jgi:hypothetical protein